MKRVSRSPYQSALEAPVVIAIEAKREDFEQGTNQCVADKLPCPPDNNPEPQLRRRG